MSSSREVSASSIAVRVTGTGRHTLKIEQYKRTKGLHRNGEYVASPKFRAGGHTWLMRFYPHGSHADATGFVGLYLELAAAGDDAAAASNAVQAEVRFTFLGPSWMQALMKQHSLVFTSTFKKPGDARGFQKAIRHLDLEDPLALYVRKGRLAVQCDIAVLVEEPLMAEPRSQEMPTSRKGYPKATLWRRSLCFSSQGEDEDRPYNKLT